MDFRAFPLRSDVFGVVADGKGGGIMICKVYSAGVVAAAAAGVANGMAVWLGALGTAQAAGLSSAAATSHALALLGRGALLTGGGGMAVGILLGRFRPPSAP